MKLSTKTLLAVGTTIVVLVALLSVFWQGTLASSYAKFEKLDTRRDVERVTNAVQADINYIDSRLNDWAAWESNYNFMVDQAPGFIADNYPSALTLADLRIHASAHITPNGQFKLAKAIPTQGKPAWVPFPAALKAELMPGKKLVSPKNPNDYISGLVRLPDGLWEVASHPIVHGDHTGPIRGSLVFARLITPDAITRMSELIHIPFALKTLDDPTLTASAKAAIERLKAKPRSEAEVVPLDDDHVVGYALLDDLYGQPVAVVFTELPRTIHNQGRETVRQSLGLLVAIGFLFALLNMLLLRIIVLRRLGRLADEVEAIGSSGSLTARVTEEGEDEISSVSQRLNGMLSQLATSQAAILELEAWRKGEQRYTELMDQSPTLVFIVTDGQIVYANPLGAAMFAAGPRETGRLQGLHFLDRFEEASRERLDEAMKRLLTGETDIIRMEVRAGRLDGLMVDLELAANRMTFREKSAIQVLAQDVTETKRMQGELARVGKEMEIATRIQTALVPVETPIERFDISMALLTATEVGGDLIDYIPQPDGRFWLAIGDVTGHGLTPGLVMMMAQSMITGYVLDNPAASPADRLIHINEALFHNVRNRLRNDNYMTLQLLRHEGEGRFVAAGMHCDLVIWRHATQTAERIEVPGFWTGLLPDTTDMTSDFRFELAPLDVLLLYSDGLIEAANAADEQYDMERLEAAIARYADRSVEAIRDAILEEVKAWLGEQEQLDDISLIVLRRHAEVPAVAEAVSAVLT